MHSGSIWPVTLRTLSQKRWIEHAPNWATRRMSLFPLQRAAFWRAANGDFSRGDLVGDLPAPTGSGPGFRRPVVVVQGDALNRSRVATTVCIPLTSNLKWGTAPGNVRLSPRLTGLRKDSVANVSQILAIDKALLRDRAGKLPNQKLELLLSGIDVVLGR
jgi:mRNA interferase MazF